MSPPEQPRKFFVDRSLGRVAVPEPLREAGWNLVTLAEHYGVPQDETIEDTRWIEDSAKFGWAVLMKDKRIRYRQAEIAAGYRASGPLLRHHSRRSHLHRLYRTLDHQPAGRLRHFQRSWPFIYAVHTDRLERLYPAHR